MATALVTLMLVVQLTGHACHEHYQGLERGTVSAEQQNWIFKEVNSVQLGMDVAWDIFISAGTFFFALVMFNHPIMNKIISAMGMVFSVLLFL